MDVALGLSVRTGKAVVVAVAGTRDAPEVVLKTRIDVATTFDEGAVYHVSQELPLAEARALIRDSEAHFVSRAEEGLAGALDGRRVAGAVIAAPEAKALPDLEAILRTHPLVHAAEIELYRRVFAGACAKLGAAARRVAPDALVGQLIAASKLEPAEVSAHLAAMGKAAGRPWAAEQKHAALAAWLALVTRRSS